jgi:predicted enzyme related to lactoylglutathione lyase
MRQGEQFYCRNYTPADRTRRVSATNSSLGASFLSRWNGCAIMYIKAKSVLTASAIAALLICCIHVQGRALASEPASGKTLDKAEKSTLKRVTGIGGVFIRAKDPAKLRSWYKTHLGIDVQAWGGTAFRWVDAAGVPANGTTAWAVSDGSNFAPGKASFMINYRVADLRGLLKALREEGCEVLEKIEESEFGIFGWVMDLEGNKVELWQPPAGQ